jgi:hypothetical protein
MYTLPRDHGVSPTHSCCIKCIRFKQFQSISISCNWLRPIHLTHLISRHHLTQMKRPRWHFCKHPHYLISLISFEIFVTITLPPLFRQGIEIIPYIKRFLEWIETLSLGGKLQNQKVLHSQRLMPNIPLRPESSVTAFAESPNSSSLALTGTHFGPEALSPLAIAAVEPVDIRERK